MRTSSAAAAAGARARATPVAKPAAPAGPVPCHGPSLTHLWPILGPNPKLLRPSHSSTGPAASCRRVLLRACGGGSSGGGGGGGGPRRWRPHGGGDGDGDGGPSGSDGSGSFGVQAAAAAARTWVLTAVGAAAFLAGLGIASPAAAASGAASFPPAARASRGATAPPPPPPPAAAATPLSGAAAASSSSSSSEPIADGAASTDAISRLRRLMREAFASLTELGARVEGLEAAAGAAAAAAEAGDGLVIPMEGFAVAPYARALAGGSDLRLRCRAQVSGTVDAPVLMPLLLAASAPEPGDGGDEFGVDGASVGAISYIAPPPLPAALRLPALAAAAGVGNPAAPALRLRIQSMWGGPSTSQTSQEAATGPGGGGAASAADGVVAIDALGGWQGGGGDGGGGAATTAAGPHPMRVTAHLQLATAAAAATAGMGLAPPPPLASGLLSSSGSGAAAAAAGLESLVIERLVMKADPHPALRLLAASRGALENVARNVNPFAAAAGLPRGLTSAMRRGHDLDATRAGGLGAAAAAAAGDLSLAFGAFVPQPQPNALLGAGAASCGGGGGGGGVGGGAGWGSGAGAASGGGLVTCGQLSLHRSRRVALSGVFSSASDGGGGDGASDGGSGSGGGGGSQRGVVGAWQLGDRATVAAWYGTGSSSGSGSESGSGFMPPTWIRVAGAGDQGGGGAAVGGDSDTGEEGPLGAWAEAGPVSVSPPRPRPGSRGKAAGGVSGGGWRLRERRAGVRLALLPDEESGRSYGLCVSHRREELLLQPAAAAAAVAGGGADGGSSSSSSSVVGGTWVVEASAAVPVAHGVLLNPGVVLLRRGAAGVGSSTVLCAAANATWSF